MAFASPSRYEKWSREELIARLIELDRTSEKTHSPTSQIKPSKSFSFSRYQTRKIAIKFCYSGWEYSGLAFQSTKTVLPTVEGVLFDALVKARLIDEEAGLQGCGWERCGRTDRGVSAAGQVISLWVRSARDNDSEGVDCGTANQSELVVVQDATPENIFSGIQFTFDKGRALPRPSLTPASARPVFEHNYVAILNRLLPSTIRILAWTPVSSSFSARFTCIHRHYKYFFSSDIIPGQPLDINRMRAAASRLIGEHDFRNFCKIDPCKQITVFKRTIVHADINSVPADLGGQGMYVLDLIGSAFLYHQVRHIMAVLFMIGSGLETPDVISAMLNVDGSVDKPGSGDSLSSPTDFEIVERKPEYQMAEALPLVLWDCAYPEKEVDWRTNFEEGKENNSCLYQQLHSIHSRSQVITTLNKYFLLAASSFHQRPEEQVRVVASEDQIRTAKYSIPLGGGMYKSTAKYVPLLQRNRLDPVEVINERWRLGKGRRRTERQIPTRQESDGKLDENDTPSREDRSIQ